MNALPKTSTDKVIDFNGWSRQVIRGGLSEKKPRLNKDGSVNKVCSHKVAGISSEVYAFQNEEEIKAMIDVFDEKINNAPDEDKQWIAARNKMMFLVGINLGIRASDLCGLKYSFFMNDNGSFKEFYSLQPKKTKKTGKFVKLYFNQTVQKAITEYMENYSVEDMNEYLFKSREGDSHITEKSLGRIIKDAAKEAGIERNICSHSLRKTFGYHVWHSAADKEKALVMLMSIFNHSSIAVTKKYIGIMDEEIEDVFNNLNLGLDFLDN